MEEFNDVFAPD